MPKTSEKRAPQEGKTQQPCYVVLQVEKCCHYFVVKGKSAMQNWLETRLITETAVSVTERGWMETALFHNCFRGEFLKNIGPQRPVLIIYDGHVTHISVEVIKVAQESDNNEIASTYNACLTAS
ncbi:hypothetical protein ILUMI_15176 [Ignelater luminosus]|uniref:DDE-1 domain-containing protein n=1 Tax=Ignelater luminosus TaxID=2038154 RepID=A0A8K0G739_IGNLU|nr:hypothetical protein ILUMI_15176 [Ignelater luminosus]